MGYSPQGHKAGHDLATKPLPVGREKGEQHDGVGAKR